MGVLSSPRVLSESAGAKTSVRVSGKCGQRRELCSRCCHLCVLAASVLCAVPSGLVFYPSGHCCVFLPLQEATAFLVPFSLPRVRGVISCVGSGFLLQIAQKIDFLLLLWLGAGSSGVLSHSGAFTLWPRAQVLSSWESSQGAGGSAVLFTITLNLALGGENLPPSHSLPKVKVPRPQILLLHPNLASVYLICEWVFLSF